MKKINLYILLAMSLTSTLITACPTCIGRLHADSPPFFSKKNNKSTHIQSTFEKKAQQTNKESHNKQSSQKKDIS